MIIQSEILQNLLIKKEPLPLIIFNFRQINNRCIIKLLFDSIKKNYFP